METATDAIKDFLRPEEIEANIKRIIVSLKKLSAEMLGFVGDIENFDKSIKNTADMNTLLQVFNELGKVVKEAATKEKEYIKITEQLHKKEAELAAAMKGQDGVLKEKIKVELKLAEVRKKLKEEAENELIAEKTRNKGAQEIIEILKRQTDSIKDVANESKELRKVRDTLNTSTDSTVIEQLNARISENTELIRANVDAATKQKMNIGNYQSAVEDLQGTLNDIARQMQELSDEGKEESKTFKDLAERSNDIKAQIDKLSQSFEKNQEKQESLRGQLRKMREELTALRLAGKQNSEEYKNLAGQAAILEDAMGDVRQEIKALASDTFTFKGVAQALSGIAGMAQAGIGVWGQLTGASEKYEKVVRQIAQAVAIANGLEKVAAVFKEESAAKTLAIKLVEWASYKKVNTQMALSVVLANAEAAAGAKLNALTRIKIALQWAWNKAIMANPLISFLAVLTAVIAGLYKLGRAITKWVSDNRKAKDSLEQLNKAVQDYINKNNELIAVMRLRGATQAEITNQMLINAEEEYKRAIELFEMHKKLYKKDSDEYKKALDDREKAADKLIAAQGASVGILEEAVKASQELKDIETFGDIGAKAIAAQKELEALMATLDILQKQGKIQLSEDNRIADALYYRWGRQNEDFKKEQKERNAKAAEEAQQKAEQEAKRLLDLKRQLEDSELAVVQDSNKREMQELHYYYERKIEDIKGNGKAEKALRVALEAEWRKAVLDKEKEFEEKSLKEKEDKLNKIIEFRRKASEEIISIAEGYTDVESMRLDREQAAEIQKLLNFYQSRSKIAKENGKMEALTEEEYEERKTAIERKYAIERLRIAVKTAEDIRNAIPASDVENRIAADKRLHDAKVALNAAEVQNAEETTVKILETEEERKAKQEENLKALESAMREVYGAARDIAGSYFESQKQELDRKSKADEEAKERELKAAGDNKELQEAINAKYESLAKRRDKEKKALEIRKAKADKMFALFEIAINTAVAISNAFRNSTNTFGLPWSAAAAAMGIAQAAAVMAKPLPKYAKGREGGPAEFAIVGEQGRELIQTKEGHQYLTPDRATITFLPDMAKVLNSKELLRLTANASLAKTVELPDSNMLALRQIKEEVASLHKGFAMLAKVVKDKREFHLNITERGMQKLATDGLNRTEYINKNIKW